MYMIAEVSQYVAVASFAEAWIEIGTVWSLASVVTVASFAEAWIEIREPICHVVSLSSPPSRRRGLKYVFVKYIQQMLKGRLLRGGVD